MAADRFAGMTDEQLVELAHGGDTAAVDTLMEKYPNIDKKKMGFGAGFDRCPVWNCDPGAEDDTATGTIVE